MNKKIKNKCNKIPQENPWEYLQIFLRTPNPQEIIFNGKIRRNILRNTCGFS
jgi:hypothetical protein